MKKIIFMFVFTLICLIGIQKNIFAEDKEESIDDSAFHYFTHDYKYPNFVYSYLKNDSTDTDRYVSMYDEGGIIYLRKGTNGDYLQLIYMSDIGPAHSTEMQYASNDSPTYKNVGSTFTKKNSNIVDQYCPNFSSVIAPLLKDDTTYYVSNLANINIQPDNLRFGECNYDFVIEDAEELKDWLKDPKKPDNKKLPYFYLKATAPMWAKNVEYTVTWDTTGSFVEGKEDQYACRFFVSATTSNKTGALSTGWSRRKSIKSTDINPVYFNQTAFSFTFGELQNMYPFFANFLDNEFYIGIQIVDSSNTPVDKRITFFSVVKIYEIRSSFVKTYNDIDTGDVASTEIKTEYEDGVMNYTDGRPTGQNTEENGERSSNGSSVSPSAVDAGVNNWDDTNGQQNGVNYGTSLNDLSTNLQGLVNSVSNLSGALASVFSFFPGWLLTLIAVSIGMIVVIGTIKLILR